MNAGVGAAFNTELQQFRKEIETIFFAQLGKPQQQLSSRAHALTVLDFQLDLHKSFAFGRLKERRYKGTRGIDLLKT